MSQVDLKLIAKKLSGELSAGEEAAFEQWLHADRGHLALFKQIEKAWKASGALYPGYSPDTEAAWEKLKAKIGTSNQEAQALPLWRKAWARLAAGLLAFMVLGLAVKYLFNGDTSSTDHLNALKKEYLQTVKITATDSLKILYLPDSSKIVLNKNSGISFAKDFADTARMLYLLGEAHFEVRKNGKPFIVYSEGTKVQVMGTSFDIKANAKDDNVQVAVLEGEVAFSSQGPSSSPAVTLKAGDKMNFNKKTKEQKKEKDTGKDVWWQDTKPLKESNFDKKVKKILMKVKKKLRKK